MLHAPHLRFDGGVLAEEIKHRLSCGGRQSRAGCESGLIEPYKYASRPALAQGRCPLFTVRFLLVCAAVRLCVLWLILASNDSGKCRFIASFPAFSADCDKNAARCPKEA